jgi:adenylate cyclase
MAQLARGIALLSSDNADRASGFDLLAEARSAAPEERFILTLVPIIDLQTAAQKARTEDLDGAIALTRNIIAEQFETGATLYLGAATTVLVESLLRRGRGADLDDAQPAIDSLAAVPTDPGFVLYELPLLRMRTLLARVRDDRGYRTCADRYLVMAQALEFEGHLATARAMK